MEAQKLKELLDRYERGECSPDEEKFVLEWYQNISVEPENPANEYETEQRLWASLKPKAKRTIPFYYKIAAAVSLLIVVGSAYLWRESNDQLISEQINSTRLELEHYTNNTTNSLDIPLADGSKVTLEPGGRLSLSPTVFNVNDREVYLSGQAFFDVKKDPTRPFLVRAKDITTRVLGTSFNIKAYDNENEITVTVVTGKVSVFNSNDTRKNTHSAARETILKPHERLVYNLEDKNILKAYIQNSKVLRADPNQFVMKYESVSITEIFGKLEENYGIDIQYNNDIMKDCLVTTSLTDETFYERIQILCKAINATYEVTDGAVVISGKGCN